MLGLDTSHATEFAWRMGGRACPSDQQVAGLQAVSCWRFPSPFCSEKSQDERHRQLEAWGVKVTRHWEEAVTGADGIFLTINDPSLHEEHFSRVAELGLPVFLDKPLAHSWASGSRIVNRAVEYGTRLCSASALRFGPELAAATQVVPYPLSAVCCGALDSAASGSEVIWYGVHAFEMLQGVMGRGAVDVTAIPVAQGFVFVVNYDDGRHGTVELTQVHHRYGGRLYGETCEACWSVDWNWGYVSLLRRLAPFLAGAPAPVSLEDTLEVMALLDAADRAAVSGGIQKVHVS